MKMRAASDSMPEVFAPLLRAIHNLRPHDWVVLVNSSKQSVWQQHWHPLNYFAQCGVLHRKLDHLRLGKLWLWQHVFQLLPNVIGLSTIAPQPSQLVDVVCVQAAFFKELEVRFQQRHHLLQELRSDVPPQHHHHQSKPPTRFQDLKGLPFPTSLKAFS